MTFDPFGGDTAVTSLEVSQPAGGESPSAFASLGRVLFHECAPHIVNWFRPPTIVEKLEVLRAQVEYDQLVAKVSAAQIHPVTAEAAVAFLPRLSIVLGAPHHGKSTLMAFIAALRGDGQPTYWCQPPETRKPIVLPPWVEREDRPKEREDADFYVDEAWAWFEAHRDAAAEWLRTLHHSRMRVVLASQSGAFLKPSVWRSGECAILHVGGNPVSDAFEREEVQELVSSLSVHAVPCERAVLYHQGVIYVFEYTVVDRSWWSGLPPGDETGQSAVGVQSGDWAGAGLESVGFE